MLTIVACVGDSGSHNLLHLQKIDEQLTYDKQLTKLNSDYCGLCERFRHSQPPAPTENR